MAGTFEKEALLVYYLVFGKEAEKCVCPEAVKTLLKSRLTVAEMEELTKIASDEARAYSPSTGLKTNLKIIAVGFGAALAYLYEFDSAEAKHLEETFRNLEDCFKTLAGISTGERASYYLAAATTAVQVANAMQDYLPYTE